LSVVARIRPEVWDAIVPHGPRFRARGDLVALNPQPLPPAEAFLVGAAEMAHEFLRVALESDVRGDSAAGFVRDFLDDWCATPWPRKWPWPWPGPRPDEGPLPDPWVVQSGRVIGAIIFASVGSRLADGELKAVFSEGADRLAEAAIEE
jgi:hypothetical protein